MVAARASILCACPACQRLDAAHPKEGRQIAMFAVSKRRKPRAAIVNVKSAD